MFQVDWHEYIKNRKREIGNKTWSLTRTVAVFINDKFLGSDEEFIRYISESYIFSLPISSQYYENIAMEQCKLFMEKSKRKYVYFTFNINNRTVGSFMFMLYSELLPLTCQYFLNLCTGYDAVAKCYKNSYYVNMYVHRIVKNGWIQCGGLVSPKEDTNFVDDIIAIPDESYCIPHDRRGVLSMKHQPPICTEGEAVNYSDTGFDSYSITSWLDNIVDKIDVRDTASVLMAERYLNGLYCLISDYKPGMDMRVPEEIHLIPKDSTGSVTEAMLQQLLLQFHPNQLTEEEKLMFVSEISKIILAYLFCYDNNKYCLKHISIGSREAIHQILEVAHKIASKAVTKSEITEKCNDLKIVEYVE
ncbi:putative inactive peptidyl-prolyl cis-trans isomerase-like 6 isoform X2 [Augochlora pura]